MGYQWSFANTYNNRMGKYKTEAEYDFIEQNIIENSKILDVGGGSGRFSIPLHNLGNDVTVVEQSKEALKMLSEQNPAIKTVQSDFMEFECSRKFDIIIAIEVTIYFEDWDLFFAKINSLLKKEGKFIFSVINPGSWRFLLRKFYNKFNDHSYFNYYYLSEIKNLLSKNLFEINSMEGFYWLPFNLTSNNPLVDFFVKTERILGLNKIISQSPWIMISATKK